MMDFISVKKYLIVLVLNLLVSSSFAQPTFKKVYSDSKYLIELCPTMDGGMVFLSAPSLLYKLDCRGDIEWTKFIEKKIFVGLSETGGVIEATNGDLLITYPSNKSIPSNQNYIVVSRLDSAGNLLWQKQYGSLNYRELPSTIIQSNDGDFTIGGMFQPNINLNINNFYFFKIDALGTLLWTRTFGENNIDNKINASIEDQDGNTIHVGTNKDSTVHSNGFIIKLDSNGEIVYSKEISPINQSFLQDIIITSDGNPIITGYKVSPNFLIVSFLVVL